MTAAMQFVLFLMGLGVLALLLIIHLALTELQGISKTISGQLTVIQQQLDKLNRGK